MSRQQSLGSLCNEAIEQVSGGEPDHLDMPGFTDYPES